MKRTLKQLVALGLGLVILAGCTAEKSREEKLSAMIGHMNSPFFMVNTNPQNLMDKSGVMDGVLPFTYELILSFFIDESVTGIDYGTDAQVVATKGSGFTPDVYVIFKIKKETTFIELIEKEANADIQEKDGFKYAIKKSDNYTVVWNEEFAVLRNIPIDFTAMLTGKGGDQGMKAVNNSIEVIKAGNEGEVNAEFKAFLERTDDIAMHFDGKGFFSFMEEMNRDQMDLEPMREIYEGMSVDVAMNFNDGEMIMAYESELIDKIKEKFSFIQEKGIDPALLNYGNGKAPVLVGSYNVQLDGMMDYIDQEMPEKTKAEMERELEKMGLVWDDIANTLTGQFVYMIDGYVTKEKVYDYGYGETYTSKSQEPTFAIAAGLLKADKLATVMTEAEQLPNGVLKMGDAYIYVMEDVFFASNDSAWANRIASGNGSKVNDMNNVLTSHPFGIYADFEAMSKLEDLNDIEPFVNMMVSFHGSANLDGGEFTFTFKDQSKNALRILTEAIADGLNQMEQLSNPGIEEELESALEDGLNELEEGIGEGQEELEEAVDQGLKELEESLKDL